MGETQIFILADDLTGANDTAIQFVKHGLSALVITHAQLPELPFKAPYDVFSLNTDTRGMNGSVAYDTVRNLIKRLKRFEGTYYKKIDSVLRGNPGSELAAVMDELNIPLAIVAPSFPANRGVLEGGMLKSGETDPSAVIDAVKNFAGTMDKKVESIPLEKIRQGEHQAAEFLLARREYGVQVCVADAVNDEDLAIIHRLSALLAQPHILAGSAALANQIAQKHSKNKNNITHSLFPDSCYPALVIAGSRQWETATQILALSNSLSVPIIRFRTDLVVNGSAEKAIALAYEEASDQIKSKAELCVIAAESMFRTGIFEGDAADDKIDNVAISSALGSLAGALMESFQFPVMISTGGDTSLEACKHLGAIGIQPLAEICPGIPIGRIVGGSCDSRHIITKSGRFGNNDTLIQIMNYIDAFSQEPSFNNLEIEENKEKVV